VTRSSDLGRLWWADWLATSPGRLRDGGTPVTDEVDHVGINHVRHGDAPLVYGPGNWLDRVGDPVAGTVEETLTGLLAALGRSVTRMLGPACYGYATVDTLGLGTS